MDQPPHKPDAPAESAFSEMLRIAGPTVATMVSYTLMTFTDKWLVSNIGPDPIYVGAQGNGGIVSWIAISFCHGMLTIINTYVSQNLGAGKPERGPAYLWNGIYIGLAYWAVILLPLSLALPWVFQIANVDPQQAKLASNYGQILLWGACFTMITRSLSQFFFGMHHARVIMISGILANILNLVLSAVLTFGSEAPETLGMFGRCTNWIASQFGVQKMGIAGSAIGTVVATLLEAFIPACVFLGGSMHRKYGTRSAWRLSWPHVRDIIKLGWPGGVMFGNEMICWGFFMVHFVSQFGPEHATAGWIAHQYMSLSFMPAVGLSVAATALVGKYQGMGRSDIAAKRAWLALKLAVVYMGVCAVVFVVFRHELIQAFVRDDTPNDQMIKVVSLGANFLIATAAFQIFDAGAMTISGALRGAGDTVVPGVVTVIASWLVIVGGGFALTNLFPNLESLGGWIAAASYICVLCVFLLFRFMSGKWKSIKVVHAA
ncbi:MAG: MATE family efflux transporter [Phycisphaerales bacterium]